MVLPTTPEDQGGTEREDHEAPPPAAARVLAVAGKVAVVTGGTVMGIVAVLWGLILAGAMPEFNYLLYAIPAFLVYMLGRLLGYLGRFLSRPPLEDVIVRRERKW